MSVSGLSPWTVLEIGGGPGVNFAYYNPARVNKIHALEPNRAMIRLAEPQQRQIKLDVKFIDLPGRPFFTSALNPATQ